MRSRIASATVLCLLLIAVAQAQAQTDPLPSWNDGPAKKAIVEFVQATTAQGGRAFVPPEARIATFDNDGTLWVEQPIYTQVTFAIDRVAAMAPKHPEWKDRQPFRAILTRDREAMARFTPQDVEKILAVTHTGMSVAAFADIATQWIAGAKHPRFKRPYTELVYQPMLEVMKYLRENGYRTDIVTGGGQEFVRVFSEAVYGVPPEHVIGSAGQTRYGYGKDGTPMLLKLPKVLLVDDKAGKPAAINLIIGRRPVAAFGNSSGDQQMLEWTQAGDGARLMLLVHHDDAAREYAYGAASKIGPFPEALMVEAKKRGWIVVSMKRDWKRIFPFE